MDRRHIIGDMLFVKHSRLPNEYQEVAYIENIYGAYINTEFSDQNGYFLKSSLMLTAYTGEGARGYVMLFGAEGSNGYGRNSIAANNNMFNYGCGDAYGNFGEAFINNKYYIEFSSIINNSFLKANGSLITIQDTGARTSLNCYLFARNTNGIASFYGTYRNYGIKLYSSEMVLARDFIPCYRKADNTIGMYDLCQSTCSQTNSPFYINAGTNNFIKGADVN